MKTTRNGGLLITVVVVITTLAVLGATAVTLLRLSTPRGIQANSIDHAYYLAKGGLAYGKTLAGTTQIVDRVLTLTPGEQIVLSVTEIESNEWLIASVGKAALATPWEAHYSLNTLVILDTPDPDPPPPFISSNVFVQGSTIGGMTGGSSSIQGDNATVVLDQDLTLGGNVEMAVSNIFTERDITLGGSSKIGSSTNPGIICIAGDLNLGVSAQNHIYGEVYVGGDFHPGQATIFGNVYVRGDVRLDTHSGQPPTMVPSTNRIYYADTLVTGSQSARIQFANEFCVYDPDVAICVMPSFPRPELRPDEWYDLRGYASSGDLSSNARIFSQGDYSSGSGRPTATNVIVVSKGNITITMNLGANVRCSGILFAPNGWVSFSGAHFEGLVIARDGFQVERQNAEIIFKNLDEFIADPDDYPFVLQ